MFAMLALPCSLDNLQEISHTVSRCLLVVFFGVVRGDAEEGIFWISRLFQPRIPSSEQCHKCHSSSLSSPHCRLRVPPSERKLWREKEKSAKFWAPSLRFPRCGAPSPFWAKRKNNCEHGFQTRLNPWPWSKWPKSSALPVLLPPVRPRVFQVLGSHGC